MRSLKPTMLALLIALVMTARAQLAVTAAPDLNWNADSAARMLVSDWLNVSNVKFNGSNDLFSCKALGKFHCGDFIYHPYYDLNIDTGLLICTGNAEEAVGPKDHVVNSWMHYPHGGCLNAFDSVLKQIMIGLNQEAWQYISSITFTDSVYYYFWLYNVPTTLFPSGFHFDGAILEFDMVPCADTVNIRYVFAAQKYTEAYEMQYGIFWGQQYDAFGLFVNGPKPGGGRYENKNIAVLPGTDTPVSVQTIHRGRGGIDPDANAEYLTLPGNPFITYGFTVPFTATVALIPDSTYHFRFSLGESNQEDCAVFVEKGAFKPTRKQSFKINDEPLSALPEWKNYCVYDEVVFSPHTSLRYGQMKWDFGDGTGAVVGDTVTHIYMTPGIYTVRNVIYNVVNPADTMCVEYDIDVRDIVTTYEYKEACMEYMWYKTENGVVIDSALLTESGIYSDTLLQVNWCDSITILELHLLYPQAPDAIYGEPNMTLPTEYLNGTFIHYVDEIEGVFGYDWELETDCGWVLSKYPQLGITSPTMCKVTVTEEGSGTLRAVTENVCGKAYMEKHLTASPLGTGEYSENKLTVSPNPTEDVFTIEAEDITAVEVFDQLGQKVMTDHSGRRTIDAASLPAGIYFLKVETATGTKYGKMMRR